MREIWRKGAATVRETVEAVNASREPQLARTTVLKTLQRLEEKGWLRRDESGRPVKYAATVKEEKAAGGVLSALRDSLFGGSSVAMVRCLIDDGGMTSQEIDELQQLIDKGRKEAP